MPLIQSLSDLVRVAGVKISIFSAICKLVNDIGT